MPLRRLTILVVSLAVLVLTLPTIARLALAAEWPRPQASYSALRTLNGAGFTMTGRVHHDHGKERFETVQQGTPMIMIRRPDTEKAYMVMPAMNMAMEMDLSQQAAMVPDVDTYAGEAPEVVGRETVAGESATRYRSTTQQAQGSYTVDFWITDDGIQLLMRGTGPQGDFEMALSEIQRGPQDPALFEPPAGVQIMPANPAMMGGQQQ